jgi:ATP-dependent Clp protease protease subunit
MIDVSTREIFIYDDIGPAWAGMFGTETLHEGLKALGSGPVSIRINSYGGSVDEALAMIEMLSRHDGDVNVTVDSIAASAASLFPAFFPSSAAPHARIMIHSPWTVAMGNSEDLRKEADVLDVYRDSLITIYEDAMGQSKDDVIALLEAETWYGASDAKMAGLVDEVGGVSEVEPDPVPQNRFKNIPQDMAISKVEAPAPPQPVATEDFTLKMEALRLKCKLHRAR